MAYLLSDRSPPFLLPCFGAFFVHIVLTALLASWTNINEEAFIQVDPGTSIKANLVSIAQPRPAPKAVAKPAPQKKTEQPPAIQNEDLDALIERLDQPTLVEEGDATADSKAEENNAKSQDKEAVDQEESDDRFNLALEYYQRNQVLVERNFNTGTAAQRKTFEGLVVRMKIFLDAEGRLKNLKIIKSSGNQIFDAETERAVRRVRRFILPADPIIVERYFEEITMEFSLSP